LKTKTDLVLELFLIKQALPNHWKENIASHELTHTTAPTYVYIILDNQNISTLKQISNKNIGNTFIRKLHVYELAYNYETCHCNTD